MCQTIIWNITFDGRLSMTELLHESRMISMGIPPVKTQLNTMQPGHKYFCKHV